MSTILAIDPSGDSRGHTGVVLLGYTDTEPVHVLAHWAVTGGIEGFREWYEQTIEDPHSALWLFDFDAVIVEQFVDRQIRGVDRSVLLVEGVVRWLWPDAILSPASGKNTAVPDAVLQRLDLWDFGKDHHKDQREAARHAVRWLKNQAHKPTLLKGWPQND